MPSRIREMERPWLFSTCWDCLMLVHLVPKGGRGSREEGKEGMGGREEQNAVLWAAGSISLAGPTLPVIKFLNLLDGSNPTLWAALIISTPFSFSLFTAVLSELKGRCFLCRGSRRSRSCSFPKVQRNPVYLGSGGLTGGQGCPQDPGGLARALSTEGGLQQACPSGPVLGTPRQRPWRRPGLTQTREGTEPTSRGAGRRAGARGAYRSASQPGLPPAPSLPAF